jgi:predicted nucleic acid-binding protein
LSCLFDASPLLNLANGDVLDVVIRIPDLRARIGPQVRGECLSIRVQLDVQIEAGHIALLDDAVLPGAKFLSLLDKYQLGVGETECLAFATLGDDVVCCDDRRARTMITKELGQKRVTGSLGLLIRAVHHDLLSNDVAFASYQQMRRRGGFLPELSMEELDAAVDAFGNSAVRSPP